MPLVKSGKKTTKLLDKSSKLFYASNRTLKIVIVLYALVLSGGLTTASSEELDSTRHYSSHFTGLNTEVNLLQAADVKFPANLRVESVGLVYTWGLRSMFPGFPLRTRVGLAWWPKQDFSLIGGLELGFLEFLSNMQARHFGLYAIVDGLLRINTDEVQPGYRPGAKILVGINTLSCIGLGMMWDNKYGWMLKLEYSSGAYLLK